MTGQDLDADYMRPAVAVDIVVPVYNALDDVKACLQALARVPTGVRSRVLVVNDGSDGPTTEWLRCAVASLGTLATEFELIEHAGNRGYTVTVNTGLKASRADYVVTLNSDTVVTPFWLDGLIRCMCSARNIGITGPLSNAANWQNVPVLRNEDGRFAINALPPGFSPVTMAALVSRLGERRYPRISFLNGFCYMIRRAVIERIGYMDEGSFPIGYGEEDDYSVRAQDAGFVLAVADDTFVYHAKSKSFGTEQRVALSKAGAEALNRKHPPKRLGVLRTRVRKTGQLDEVRARIATALVEANTNMEERVRIGTELAMAKANMENRIADEASRHTAAQEGLAETQIGIDGPEDELSLARARSAELERRLVEVIERCTIAETIVMDTQATLAKVVDRNLELTKEVESKGQELGKLDRRFQQAQDKHAKQLSELEKKRSELEKKRSELEKKRSELEKKRSELEHRLREAQTAHKMSESRYRAIVGSTSWRLTAPLRFTANKFKRSSPAQK